MVSCSNNTKLLIAILALGLIVGVAFIDTGSTVTTADVDALSDEELDAAMVEQEDEALAGNAKMQALSNPKIVAVQKAVVAQKPPFACSNDETNLIMTRGDWRRTMPRYLCVRDASYERVCRSSGYTSVVSERCANGCDRTTGRCQVTCLDSDGEDENRLYVRGTTSGVNDQRAEVEKFDTCLQFRDDQIPLEVETCDRNCGVSEKHCAQLPGGPFVSGANFPCPSGCENGACKIEGIIFQDVELNNMVIFVERDPENIVVAVRAQAGSHLELRVNLASTIQAQDVEVEAELQGYESADHEGITDRTNAFDLDGASEAPVRRSVSLQLQLPQDIQLGRYIVRLTASNRDLAPLVGYFMIEVRP